MCDSHAQIVTPSVIDSVCLLPSPGLITVAVVSTAVSHVCDNGYYKGQLNLKELRDPKLLCIYIIVFSPAV